jgi:chromosome segregation ATPase
MPIEWTEKKTEETRKQLRVAPIVRAMAMGGITFASADTHPATIDDLAAAIRGMGEEEKKHIFHACELGDPCAKCAAQRDEALRDLANARNALESARAEAERLLSCKKDQASLLRQQRDELQDSEEQIRTLNERLEARNQELDNQKAEIDRLKANQIPIEVEPEWVRRMPEWAKEELRHFDVSLPVYHAAAPHTREAIRELVGATIDIDTTDPHRSLHYLHNAIRHALRAAYLARKAGGE